MTGKDMNEAVHLFALLIKRIREEDGAEAKPCQGWAKRVYWTMKRFEGQFLYQTEFIPMMKIVRLGIRDVGDDVLGYTYPCQDKNRDWLQHTNVCFIPTPSDIYQDQQVSGAAGVDFEPRFTPEHCYPFRLVLHGKLIKDFLIHPELVSASDSPTVVCWWKAGPIKTCRIETLGNSGDRMYEGFVTIDSNRMKPPIKFGRPYRVREFLLAKDVLRETGSKRFEIAAEELFSERRLLEFVRELDMDSMDEDPPRWTEGDSLYNLSKAYLSDLSIRLKAKLAEVRLDQPPLYRTCCPAAHFTSSSFLIGLVPEAPLQSRALYIVEVKGRETRLLTGVTLGLFEGLRRVGLSLRHIHKAEWNLVFSFWVVTELDQYISEFEVLPKVLSQRSCSQPFQDLCALLQHLEACPRLTSPCSAYEGLSQIWSLSLGWQHMCLCQCRKQGSSGD